MEIYSRNIIEINIWRKYLNSNNLIMWINMDKNNKSN